MKVFRFLVMSSMFASPQMLSIFKRYYKKNAYIINSGLPVLIVKTYFKDRAVFNFLCDAFEIIYR